MLANALVLLGAAILVATVFHTVKLPPIVAFLTAGVLVGPSGFGLISSIPQVENLTEIAAVLLMFTIGLEFSLKELLHYRRSILILGVGQIFVTIVLFSFLFWLIFSFPLPKAIFLSMLVAPSSTAVVLKLLFDNRDIESPYGKASFSILLLQDMAIIPMIVAVPFLVSSQSVTTLFLESLFPLILLATLAVVIFYILSKYVLPFVFHRVSQTRNREIFFFSVLFVCMGAAALMHKVGLSVSLGAFIAGMLLAGSSYGKQATAEILPLRDSFLSLFFVAIGMMLDLNFLFTHFHQIFLIGLGVIAIKSLIIFSVIWLTGNSGGVSRSVTALLFQFGEFSFILAELGTKHDLLSESERQTFVAIAITSLALTPFLYAKISWFLHSPFFDKWIPLKLVAKAQSFRLQFQRKISRPLVMEEIVNEKPLQDHVVVIGYGVAGQSLCRVLEHLKASYQVIELNPETVRIHSEKIPIVFGDATNPELLKKVGIERAKLVVIVTSGVNMLEPILHSITQLNPQVKILARTNYLLDLNKLRRFNKVSFITSELEAMLKIIEETLNIFEADSSLNSELVMRIRQEF